MREFRVTYDVMIPDKIKVCGERLVADDSVDDDIHYFFHPDDDMEHDMDLTVTHGGDIILIIGDEVMGAWRLHNPSTWEGQDTNIDLISDAVKMAEEVYADMGVDRDTIKYRT